MIGEDYIELNWMRQLDAISREIREANMDLQNILFARVTGDDEPLTHEQVMFRIELAGRKLNNLALEIRQKVM